MNKFITLVVLAAAVVAEPPVQGGYSSGGSVSAGRNFASGNGGSSGGGSGINEYVDEALLARVAQLIASGGDGSAGQQDNEGARYVDDSIFSQVAARLGGNGGSGRVSTEYGAPAPGGQPSLGQPEPAQRIAEFDLTDSSASSGGYSGAVPPAPQAPQAPSQGYGAPSQRFSQPQQNSFSRGGSSGGAITLGQPEVAQRVAEFDASSSSGGQQTRGNQGGNQGGYQ